MDLVRLVRRRVDRVASAPGSGVPSRGLSPTSSGSSASTGRAPSAPRGSSPATPPPPRTSRRRPSWPRSATSTASTGAALRARGCTGSSSTARSTGRGRARLRAEVELGDYLPAPPAPEPDGGALARIASLAPEHRAVVVLRYVLEYTPGEIAELLDLPRGTVNSRLRRGLDRMREGAVSDAEERAGRSSGARSRSAAAPRRTRARRPLVLAGSAVALVAAVVAAVFSPPGRAVFERVREAVGVEHADPALFSLPAPGRLLVVSARRRRRLARRAATASSASSARTTTPSGRRTGSTSSRRGANELHRTRRRQGRSLDARAPRRRRGPAGKARAPTRGSPTSPRAASASSRGDGTGDRLLDRHGARRSRRPGIPRDASHGRVLRRRQPIVLRATTAAASSGARQVAVAAGRARVVDRTAGCSRCARRTAIVVLDAQRPRAPHDLDARQPPHGDRVQARRRTASPSSRARRRGASCGSSTSTIRAAARLLFAGPGAFGDIVWSPDGALAARRLADGEPVDLPARRSACTRSAKSASEFPRATTSARSCSSRGRWCCELR